MSFYRTLERLREAASARTRGFPTNTTVVSKRDLSDLLHHFERLDTNMRAFYDGARKAAQNAQNEHPTRPILTDSDLPADPVKPDQP